MSIVLEKYLEKLNELGWENLPPGWTNKSMKDFAWSVADDSGSKIGDKEWFDACVSKVEGELDDPNAFCASVADTVKGDPYWRGEPGKGD